MFWVAMLRKARVYRLRPCTPVDAAALYVVWRPAVRVRLVRAWDSLTAARQLQRQLLFDSEPTPSWT